jgi:hypothetical protein
LLLAAPWRDIKETPLAGSTELLSGEKRPADRSLLIVDEFPADHLLFEDATQIIEFKGDLDLLETLLASHQDFTANVVGFALVVEFQAGIVINVDLSLDDFATPFAFHGELVECSPVGRGRGYELLKEIHRTAP